jgi:hypothetical protein
VTATLRRLVWSGTGRRLFLAFASLIALYALAASVAIHGLMQISSELA